MTSLARTPDLDREVARRAYEIWEDEGRPNGRDRDHWARAEQAVLADTAPAPTAEATTAPAKRRAPRAKIAALAADAPAPARKPARRKTSPGDA
jgi:hypothetical protein